MFKLEITAGGLASALSQTQTVINASSQIPVLKAVHIDVSGEQATFTATNTDQSVRVATPSKGNGTVCIDTSLLYVKAAQLKADQIVSINSDDDKFATMTQGKTKWKIPLLDATTFPENVTSEIVGDHARLDAPKFLSALKSVSVAMSQSNGTHYLMGVYFHVVDGGFKLVATDGKRLHLVALDDDAGKFKRSFIIPSQSVNHILKLFANSGGVDLKVDEFGFSLADQKSLFKSKQVEGNYPDYAQIVPGGKDGIVIVDAEELVAVMSRACSINTGEKVLGVSAKASITKDSIEIKSNNSGGEEGFDICGAERIEGDDLNIGLPSRQVIEAINSFPGADSLALHFKENSNPFMITRWPNDREDLRIVMPVRY